MTRSAGHKPLRCLLHASGCCLDVMNEESILDVLKGVFRGRVGEWRAERTKEHTGCADTAPMWCVL